MRTLQRMSRYLLSDLQRIVDAEAAEFPQNPEALTAVMNLQAATIANEDLRDIGQEQQAKEREEIRGSKRPGDSDTTKYAPSGKRGRRGRGGRGGRGGGRGGPSGGRKILVG